MPSSDVVLLGYQRIGDLIWHVPAIHALAGRAGAKVVVFSPEGSEARGLLAHDPFIARVEQFERARGLATVVSYARLFAALRRGRFQRAWVLHPNPRLAQVAAWAGIPERFGFGFGRQKAHLNAGVGLPEDFSAFGRGGQVEWCRRFMALNDVPMRETAPDLWVGAAERAAIAARFGAMPRPWIVLGCTCADAQRRWPAACFGDLAQNLLRVFGGSVFLFGGPAHVDQTQAVLAAAGWPGFRMLDVAGLGLPIGEGMALIAAADLFIGNDTGPLNLAAAVDVPTFGLFGYGPPHGSISPRVHAIGPDDGWTSLADGMTRLGPRRVFDSVAPVLRNAGYDGAG